MANRKIKFYKEYFQDFYSELDERTQKKVLQVLVWIQSLDIIPVSLMRVIAGTKGLYEIRIEYQSNIYRIFCCFDKGELVILFNGFQKKSQKTPIGEIRRAKGLMNEYFESKK
ncbi:MAG: type II toxin-antitoxin system RelE/ParE family toxin [Bacteroidales bacterium]|nr:type II toxin-antitoxin system RelE/ParE family toxin [Candidatus Minthousia equi]